ncbi:hypothetical protein [Emcibacter nanhaiensis]|uniref:Pre ATP-grasp domain-containing protein n=1 Tax=Emcibacter nanhaiensis TaxID=1505037 RepID=A0A501PFN0_9PROT|nr:hypothetical protein [Emcibacter nanhaiensis]TPD58948.1 hypothetical protein FIV46_13790 [Emcibacter nanhaiensis]
MPEKARSKVRELAKKMLAENPQFDAGLFVGEGVVSGWSSGPSVFFEDHRDILLTTEEGARDFEYRSLALAGDGDFYLLSRDRDRNYERYLREFPALGTPEILQLTSRKGQKAETLAAKCIRDPAIMERLVKRTREAGGLNLVPFISTGDAWSLARSLARESEETIRVAGPLPDLSRLANDKLWFAERVREVIGPQALPPTFAEYNLSAAAAHIRKLAGENKHLMVKLTNSGGSMGNLLFPSDRFNGHSLEEIQLQLQAHLINIGWRHQFPILLCVWEQPVTDNPSVQVWIPDAKEGPPVIEGVFNQFLIGDRGEFVGAEPARLPEEIMASLLEQGQRLALLFQFLNYFGRISFDAIVLAEEAGGGKIHWIECNARWGGVSIPMTLLNRLRFSEKPGAAVCVQKYLYGRHARPFPDIIAALGSWLLKRPEREYGAVFLQPTGGQHLNFMVLEESREQALNLAKEITGICLESS